MSVFDELREMFERKGLLDEVIYECYGCCEGLIESYDIKELINDLENAYQNKGEDEQ